MAQIMAGDLRKGVTFLYENNMMLLSMQQETMLKHPNIQTKHMAVIYRRCLTKEEH